MQKRLKMNLKIRFYKANKNEFNPETTEKIIFKFKSRISCLINDLKNKPYIFLINFLMFRIYELKIGTNIITIEVGIVNFGFVNC